MLEAKCMDAPYQAHLLIDGYNVIHSWPELRQLMKKSPDAACNQLFEQVRVIHDEDRCRVSVVFDGNREAIEVEHPTGQETLSRIYSPSGLSADGVIEQIVSNARKPELYTVVTRDNLIAESVRSRGGIAIGPDDLIDWVKRCGERQARFLADHRKKTKRQWKEESPWNKL